MEKNQNHSIEQKRVVIDAEHPTLSIGQQCKLLGLTRSSSYYQGPEEAQETLLLMRLTA